MLLVEVTAERLEKNLWTADFQTSTSEVRFQVPGSGGASDDSAGIPAA
jgi:hypothetical protein